jgi:hypothetical protein
MIERLKERFRHLAREEESGQAMVEFVLVFPIQLFLTLVILQFAFLAHAHVVVSQAAFMGARAAAVYEGVSDLTPEEAAKREVARHVALLTTGGSAIGGGISLTPETELRWPIEGNRTNGFSPDRAREAYQLISGGRTAPNDGPLLNRNRSSPGWLACDVTFDYVMEVPVANRVLAAMDTAPGARPAAPAGTYAAPGGGQRYTTFRVRRVGWIATPWTEGPP